MSTSRYLAATVGLLACLGAASAATAQDTDLYTLVYTLQLETGKSVEMPFNYITGYPACLHAKKKVEVGKVIPRGVLVAAGGASPSATILSAKCVLS